MDGLLETTPLTKLRDSGHRAPENATVRAEVKAGSMVVFDVRALNLSGASLSLRGLK